MSLYKLSKVKGIIMINNKLSFFLLCACYRPSIFHILFLILAIKILLFPCFQLRSGRFEQLNIALQFMEVGNSQPSGSEISAASKPLHRLSDNIYPEYTPLGMLCILSQEKRNLSHFIRDLSKLIDISLNIFFRSGSIRITD